MNAQVEGQIEGLGQAVFGADPVALGDVADVSRGVGVADRDPLRVAGAAGGEHEVGHVVAGDAVRDDGLVQAGR